ncbi:MAG TPA: glycosyltransferase [Anaerolineae bacterium]|nr:glycosyltransferase [Anaerolineae bacterium]
MALSNQTKQRVTHTPKKSHSTNLISVIIPNYNHGQYIIDAIDSILRQDYHNYEIIVIDDGSTDNTGKIVAKYGDKVNYIWQENQGLSAARNHGIRLAKGDFIALLDADDIYEPDFMSTLIDILQQNPSADGIFCGYQFVDNVDIPLPGGEARSISANQLYDVLLDGNFLVPESILIRRYCYEAVGPFDESLRACEDWDMWLRISKQYQIIGTDKILTRHRVLPGSMSTDPIRMLNNRLTVLEKHFGSLTGSSADWTLQKRKAYGYGYLTSCVEYLQYQDIDRAYECFRKMVEVYPDLLTTLSTYYELGCGNQPKGFRGHFPSLDVQYNAKILFKLLETLFSDGQIPKTIIAYRKQAYADANMALGMLSYGAGDLPSARKFLGSAIMTDPKFGFNRTVATTLLKSMLGTKLLHYLKPNQQPLVTQ